MEGPVLIYTNRGHNKLVITIGRVKEGIEAVLIIG